jgi:hypothetical protein
MCSVLPIRSARSWRLTGNGISTPFRSLLSEGFHEPEDGTCEALLDRLGREIPQPALHLAQARLKVPDDVQRQLRVTVHERLDGCRRPLEFHALGDGNGIRGVEPVQQGGTAEDLAWPDILDDDPWPARGDLNQPDDTGDDDMHGPGWLPCREEHALGRNGSSLRPLQQVPGHLLLEALKQAYEGRVICHSNLPDVDMSSFPLGHGSLLPQ